jgi:hypothetical protein
MFFNFLCSCISFVFSLPPPVRLQTLPVHIGDLQQLKELHVRNNRLRYLPASVDLLHLYTFTGELFHGTLPSLAEGKVLAHVRSEYTWFVHVCMCVCLSVCMLHIFSTPHKSKVLTNRFRATLA